MKNCGKLKENNKKNNRKFMKNDWLSVKWLNIYKKKFDIIITSTDGFSGKVNK